MTNGDSATFIDLDISILKAMPGIYPVTARTSDGGVASGMLDWPKLEGADFVAKLEQIREEPYSTNQDMFREVGTTLFDALFKGDVRRYFETLFTQKVLGDASSSTYLRLRLDINDAASEIAVLPWEFMFSTDDGVFLGTQNNTLLTRNFLNWRGGAIQPLEVKTTPRVLVVIPRGSGLDTDKEEQFIRQSLDAAEIPFDVLKNRVPLQDMVDKLAEGRHHILHFIGHGEFRENDDGSLHGSLRFNASYEEEDEEADEEWVEDWKLQGILGNHKSVQLALLNACKGAQLAEKTTGQGFVGTAIGLLKGHVPAVIAMQYSIQDNVAHQFSETFYKRLTTPGPWAGHVDIAIAQARSACLNTYDSDRGFGTPILYLRAKDGKIFELPQDTDLSPAPNGTKDQETSQCKEPPKPERRLLDKHALSDAEILAGDVESIRKRIEAKQKNIRYWKSLEDSDKLIFISGGFVEKIAQAQAEIETLTQELDNTIAVAEWKAYELCLETEEKERELKALEEERDALEAQGQRVPYSLTGKIGRTSDQLIKLQVSLENVREKLEA